MKCFWSARSVSRSWSHARLFSDDKTQSVAEFMVIHIVEDVSEAFAQCRPTLLCVGVELDCSSSSLKTCLTNYLTSRCLRLMCIDRAECQADDAGYMRNPWLQVICRMSCKSVAFFLATNQPLDMLMPTDAWTENCVLPLWIITCDLVCFPSIDCS